MKIATFNVEFLFDEGTHRHSGKDWVYPKEYVAARVEHLAKEFLSIDADILFLQEVASETMIQKIIARTGKDYSYFLATPDKFGVRNAVLYKDKSCTCKSIAATTEFPVLVRGDKDAFGNRLYSRRAFVHLITAYNDKALHLFGLHLNSRFFVHLRDEKMQPLPTTTQIEAADSLIRSEVFRSVQARKMRQVIDAVFATDKNAQIGVMGDFNSTERDTPLRIIQGEFGHLDDALLSPASSLPLEKRYSFIGVNGKKLIDYILISKSLAKSVGSFQILNGVLSNHSNQLPSPTFIESDHAPLILSLK